MRHLHKNGLENGRYSHTGCIRFIGLRFRVSGPGIGVSVFKCSGPFRCFFLSYGIGFVLQAKVFVLKVGVLFFMVAMTTSCL